MKTTLIHWYANAVQSLSLFVKQAVQPVRYATSLEAGIIAGIGVALLLAGLILSRIGLRTPDYEAAWTEKRLQFTGVFGTVAIVVAFLRYEGIPYASMTLVLVSAILWVFVTIVQLLRYRWLVVQVARTKWSEHKAREQYLPEARTRRPAR